MKYGILGGTFDPPHVGHLHIAHEAMRQLGLDEVVWIPAYRNPLKRGKSSGTHHRLRMCRMTVETEQGMAVSDVETTRGGDSYLVDTLAELKLVMPGEYWFIVGMDAVASFPEWKDPEGILRLCRLAVVARPGTDTSSTLERLGPDLNDAIDFIEAAPRAVSSSNIRDMVVRGEDYSRFVAPKVHDYIEQNGLYKN